MMVEEHERAFRAAYYSNMNMPHDEWNGAWGSKSPRTWFRALRAEAHGLEGLPVESHFPDQKLSRATLRQALWNTSDPTLSTLLVLAWGEMRIWSARRFLELSDNNAWQALASQLRTATQSRKHAYDKFRLLAENNQIPYLGPAYYTKLIYFLRSPDLSGDNVGFIMDQWTANSVNLLAGKMIVKMDRQKTGHYVSSRNNSENYEQFNLFIENLAHQLRAKPENIEMTLFCRGGKSKGSWRGHVIKTLKAAGNAVPADGAE